MHPQVTQRTETSDSIRSGRNSDLPVARVSTTGEFHMLRESTRNCEFRALAVPLDRGILIPANSDECHPLKDTWAWIELFRKGMRYFRKNHAAPTSNTYLSCIIDCKEKSINLYPSVELICIDGTEYGRKCTRSEGQRVLRPRATTQGLRRRFLIFAVARAEDRDDQRRVLSLFAKSVLDRKLCESLLREWIAFVLSSQTAHPPSSHSCGGGSVSPNDIDQIREQ